VHTNLKPRVRRGVDEAEAHGEAGGRGERPHARRNRRPHLAHWTVTGSDGWDFPTRSGTEPVSGCLGAPAAAPQDEGQEAEQRQWCAPTRDAE